MTEVTLEQAAQFAELFTGFEGAYGTGAGRWVKQRPSIGTYRAHLEGHYSGIGIAPLMPDSNVRFCAIDLDEPDFDAAKEMQEYIPGRTWLEQSRSGNAHVWAFFTEPLEAWVAMGILKEATRATGKNHVEIFPKNYDFTKVKFGNYINLPFHGFNRPIIDYNKVGSDASGWYAFWERQKFLNTALAERSDPESWRSRARWLLIEPPGKRDGQASFGDRSELHMCAEYIIANRDDNPVLAGSRNAVYFALAKMLTNCILFDHDEALDWMQRVNESSPDRVPLTELRRILSNAERGQYTSYGCDDPLVQQYADPQCPIANP